MLLSASNISTNPEGFESNEGAITVNPRSPSRLFATFIEYENGKNSIGARFSTDGGTTWRNSDTTLLFPGISDPVAAFDQFGNLFLAYLTDSDQADMSFVVVVAVSYNSGMSFARSVRFDGFDADQPKIATGPGGLFAPGQVVVSWSEGNMSSDTIYARAAAVLGLPFLSASSRE